MNTETPSPIGQANVFRYSVTPNLDFDKGVIQLAMSHQFSELQEQITNAIIRTREEATQKALVALGWTPPPGLEVQNVDGYHHFTLVVKNHGSRESAEAAVLFAFASRSPDGCSFHLQK